jgi:Fe-S-cluster containining protein
MKNQCRGCTTCCQWGGDLRVTALLLPKESKRYRTRPGDPTRLQVQKNGDCIYLDRSSGCTIYADSPAYCQRFNCLELLDRVMMNKRNVFMRTLMEAVRIKLALAKAPSDVGQEIKSDND